MRQEKKCPVCKRVFLANYEGRVCCSGTCAQGLLGSFEERFWKRVNKNGPTMPHMKTCCWTWVGKLEWNGRARIRKEDRTRVLVHRASWEMKNGSIPESLLVCHRCDNGACVRPGNLFLGTHKDNLDDMKAKGRKVQVFGETHGGSRLTERQVIRLLAEYASGSSTQKQLAKKYKVHFMHVHRIVTGKRWKHLQQG